MSHLMKIGSNLVRSGGNIFGVKTNVSGSFDLVSNFQAGTFGIKLDSINDIYYVSGGSYVRIMKKSDDTEIGLISGFQYAYKLDIDILTYYVADGDNRSIRIVRKSDNVIIKTVPNFTYPFCVALDAINDRYYVGDLNTVKIVRKSDDVILTTLTGVSDITPAGFTTVTDIAVDNDRIYCCSSGTSKIHIIKLSDFSTVGVVNTANTGIALDNVHDKYYVVSGIDVKIFRKSTDTQIGIFSPSVLAFLRDIALDVVNDIYYTISSSNKTVYKIKTSLS